MTLGKIKMVAAALVLVVGLLGTGTTVLLRYAVATQPIEAEAAGPVAASRGANREEVLVNIPSQRDGVLVVVGTEVQKGEKVPADRILTVKIGGEVKKYRRLRVGDRVEEGQLLARVDDRLAREEVKVRKAKLEAAEAERRAAIKTKEEAEKRYEIIAQARERRIGSFSQDDVRAAKLSRDRYTEELAGKAAGVRVAQAELHAAETLVTMHEIRSSVQGVIRSIRKHRGEAVKSLETVFVIRPGEPVAKPAAPEAAEGGERQEVPAERDGKLIFLGTEIKPGERVPPEKTVKAETGFLAVEIGPNENVPAERRLVFADHPGKAYRRANKGDDLRPEQCVVARETKAYRKLEVGVRVKEGQLLGLVNPVLALDELAVKNAGFDASEVERRIASKARDEAHKRWENLQNGSRRTPGAFSQDDVRAAKFAYDRSLEEEAAKAAAVRKAQRELNAALTVLEMHEIRSSIPGVIKRIYKHRGEAVKNLEPVLLIQGGK